MTRGAGLLRGWTSASPRLGPPPRQWWLRVSKRGPPTPRWASPALSRGAPHNSRCSLNGIPAPQSCEQLSPLPGAAVARGPWPPQVAELRATLPAPRLSALAGRSLSGCTLGVPELGSLGEMPLGHIMRLDLEKIALEYIVPCLHEVGFCYLDNFLGEVVGDCVLERVKQLHCNGALRDGQLAGPRAGVSKRHLRGDQITWIGGNEEGCEAISFLLSLIDRLVLYCGSRLGKYYVKERSKVGRARVPGRCCSPRGLGTLVVRGLSPWQGCKPTLVFNQEARSPPGSPYTSHSPAPHWDRLLETLCMVRDTRTHDLKCLLSSHLILPVSPSLCSEGIPAKALLVNSRDSVVSQCGIWLVEFGRCGKSLTCEGVRLITITF